MFEKNDVQLNRHVRSLTARRRQSHVSVSMLGRCFTTPGLFLKRRLQGCGIETSKAATRQQTPCNIATNQLPSFCDFACCATPLLKQPSRVPGCLIICRATSGALPSFISVAVGVCCRHACQWAPATCREWSALAATACVVLLDTAVLVILAPNMLAPGRYRRDIPCLRISLPYIVGPRSSSLSAVGQVGQECWRVEARQRLLLVRPFSSRFTLACYSYFATSIRTALVLLV